jgi:hypothetical protein
MITYSTSQEFAANLVTISSERAKEIIRMNKKGQKPVQLNEEKQQTEEKKVVTEYENVVGQDSLTRFDKSKKDGKNNHKRHNHNNRHNNNRPKNQGNNPNNNPNQK